MTAPPAMSKTIPVIHAASSEARKRAARATSSGVPRRLRGWVSTSVCCTAAGMRSWCGWGGLVWGERRLDWKSGGVGKRGELGGRRNLKKKKKKKKIDEDRYKRKRRERREIID